MANGRRNGTARTAAPRAEPARETPAQEALRVMEAGRDATVEALHRRLAVLEERLCCKPEHPFGDLDFFVGQEVVVKGGRRPMVVAGSHVDRDGRMMIDLVYEGDLAGRPFVEAVLPAGVLELAR